MSSPYLQRPVRSLPQAIEEIARERGVPPESLYPKAVAGGPGEASPKPAKDKAKTS
jgi:hypothetical protein